MLQESHSLLLPHLHPLRLRAQTLTAEDGIQKRHRQYTVDLSHDATKYKAYVEGILKTISDHTETKVGAVEQLIHGAVHDNIRLLG